MTIMGVLRPVGTRPVMMLALVLLLAACAERGSSPPPQASPTAALPEDDDALVLQVRHVGGFVTPEMLAARLPVVSVYADGRVLSEGPVIAIYPAPAMPNVQMARVDPAEVHALVERALAAGVAETTDLGMPPIADAPTMRFTLVTESGTHVREAYALFESPDAGGLSEEQIAARDRLSTFLGELTSLSMEQPSEEYRPDVLAAVVRPWVDPQDDLEHTELPWPGPPLPGEPLGGLPEQSCVTVSGAELAPVLEAARQANAATPWLGADGGRWSLTFRPLLPHEVGCADLLAE